MNYILHFLLFLFSYAFTDHPFYVSVTDIHYNRQEKTLQVAQKLFWDDLELALTGVYNEKVDILKCTPKDRFQIMAAEYLLLHNKITVNGRPATLKYVGLEIEEDVIWFYLEATDIPIPNKVIIINTVLTDYFEEQKNITNFYLNEKPKSIITNKKRTQGEFTF